MHSLGIPGGFVTMKLLRGILHLKIIHHFRVLYISVMIPVIVFQTDSFCKAIDQVHQQQLSSGLVKDNSRCK